MWQFVVRSGSSSAGCGIDKIFVYLVRIVDGGLMGRRKTYRRMLTTLVV